MPLIKLREDLDAAMLLFRPKFFSCAHPIQTAKKICKTTLILPFI
jgi:hypothetical protein